MLSYAAASDNGIIWHNNHELLLPTHATLHLRDDDENDAHAASSTRLLHLAQDHGAHVSVLVVDGHSKRHLEVSRRLLDGIQKLNERSAIVK